MTTLTKACRAVGIERCRTWREFLAKCRGFRERAESLDGPQELLAASDFEERVAGGPSRYDLLVTWDESTAIVSVSHDGSRWLWVHGTIAGQRSEKIYLAPKRGKVYHLVFLPHEAHEGRPVLVNGVRLGMSRVSCAPGSEWGLEGLVDQARVELPGSSAWVAELARAMGKSL